MYVQTHCNVHTHLYTLSSYIFFNCCWCMYYLRLSFKINGDKSLSKRGECPLNEALLLNKTIENTQLCMYVCAAMSLAANLTLKI